MILLSSPLMLVFSDKVRLRWRLHLEVTCSSFVPCFFFYRCGSFTCGRKAKTVLRNLGFCSVFCSPHVSGKSLFLQKPPLSGSVFENLRCWSSTCGPARFLKALVPFTDLPFDSVFSEDCPQPK